MEAVPGQESGENHFPTNLIDSEKSKDKIIRTESPEELNQRYKGKIEIPDLVKIAEHLFEEIEEKYGIPVPASFFVGRDNSANSIVDKIEGKNLAQANVSGEIIPQVQKLYASVAKYFLDKLMHGGFYLTDLNNPNQYVYGRKRGESEDKIYFIDTDIYIHNSRIGLYMVVEWLTRHMAGTESRFGRLDEARSYIGQFISQPVPENMTDFDKEEVESSISGIKRFLNGEKLGPSPKQAIPSW